MDKELEKKIEDFAASFLPPEEKWTEEHELLYIRYKDILKAWQSSRMFSLEDLLAAWDDGWQTRSVTSIELPQYKKHYILKAHSIDINKIKEDE